MRSLRIRWAIYISLLMPLLATPMMSCGNNNEPPGGVCTTTEDCPEGQNCVEGECEQEDPDGCENFFSCESSLDCVDQGFSSCEDGCCE